MYPFTFICARSYVPDVYREREREKKRERERERERRAQCQMDTYICFRYWHVPDIGGYRARHTALTQTLCVCVCVCTPEQCACRPHAWQYCGMIKFKESQ